MTETYAAVQAALERALLRVVAVHVDQLPDLPRPAFLPDPPRPSRAAARAEMDALIARGRKRA